MFTEMRLESFKGWEDTGKIRLAPITLFFGANSTGKTSLLQAILLLKQTAESTDRTRVLHPGNEHSLIDLGTVPDLVFGHVADRVLKFRLSWEEPEPIALPGGAIAGLGFSMSVEVAESGEPILREARYDLANRHVGMKRRGDGAYDLFAAGVELKRPVGRPWPLPSPVRFYGFPDEVRSYRQNADWLADLSLAFERQLGRVHYVGPLREYPKRSYLWAGERPPNVGKKGELAVPAILAARTSKQRIGRGEGKGRRYVSFEAHLAEWLKRTGVVDTFGVEAIGRNRKDYEVKVRRTAKSTEVLITDVGFGVSQILPLLVQAFYASPSSTVIFEQPEIHLHPKIQADLADLLIDAAMGGGVQFIVESHSEHLLRRLQRRIAEEKIRQEDVALYVCDVEGGACRLSPLEVDVYGNVTNWPKDFFGDDLGDVAAMTRAALERRKKQA